MNGDNIGVKGILNMDSNVLPLFVIATFTIWAEM